MAIAHYVWGSVALAINSRRSNSFLVLEMGWGMWTGYKQRPTEEVSFKLIVHSLSSEVKLLKTVSLILILSTQLPTLVFQIHHLF